jgi:hypothetical protein
LSVARRRHVAPAREAVDPARFEAPIFAACRPRLDLLRSPAWPSVAELDALLLGARHRESGRPLRFVRQDAALLADGLHYEERIHARGEIATREANWHDLFNALAWLEHGALKAALNARQVADIERVGPATRTRAQCALTHFDEAGVVVRLRDPALLPAWDAHDWARLFRGERAAWQDGRAEAVVFGHALFEHALEPQPLATAKCLVVLDDSPAPAQTVAASLAVAIANGVLLADPQELRPLPLDGIPGWHPRNDAAAFYAEAPCFRPLRPGRLYPPPARAAA